MVGFGVEQIPYPTWDLHTLITPMVDDVNYGNKSFTVCRTKVNSEGDNYT